MMDGALLINGSRSVTSPWNKLPWVLFLVIYTCPDLSAASFFVKIMSHSKSSQLYEDINHLFLLCFSGFRSHSFLIKPAVHRCRVPITCERKEADIWVNGVPDLAPPRVVEVAHVEALTLVNKTPIHRGGIVQCTTSLVVPR